MGKRNFLVTVDHHSDFLEVNILNDLTPQSVITACQQNFARHGAPQRVLTDNATNFVNRHMVKFAKDWDFELVTSAPHHQQANGKSEAAVKIVKRLLTKANETGTDFWYALLHWRNIPNKIGSSPSARLFSRSTRCGVPSSITNLCPNVVDNVPGSIEENRRKIKYHYDKNTRSLPILKTGSPVYVQLTPETSKVWTPGTVLNKLSERSYAVEVGGREFRRSLVNIKPRKEPDTLPSRQPLLSFQSENGHTLLECENSENQSLRPTDNESAVSSPARESSETSASVTLTHQMPTQMTNRTPYSKECTTGGKRLQDERMTRPKRQIKIPEKLKDFHLS